MYEIRLLVPLRAYSAGGCRATTTTTCSLSCPRCHEALVEYEPNGVWLRHWICDACLACWRLEQGIMRFGRKHREEHS